MEGTIARDGAVAEVVADSPERRRVMWRRIVVTQVDRLSGRAGDSDVAARDAAARADRLVALLALDGPPPAVGSAH